MKPYLLAESNWKTIKEENFNLVILPWGATEAHNYHLPYATDNIQAERIAEEAARIAWQNGAKVTVLPTIPFGVNTGQADIKLDININPSTQLAILRDIVQVLRRQGMYKLMILNGHGGNDFKPIIRELGLEFQDMFICLCNWFQFKGKMDFFKQPGDHADEMETSLMLYLSPSLVRPLQEAGLGAEKKNRILAFREGWVWAERKWSQVTEDTGIGDPTASTIEKGERFFCEITNRIAEVLLELDNANTNDLYI
ncbi:creatininase family protein [Pedobacter terrae]|nr:creatininase family protein [Pedobacter terrae]